MGWRRSVIALLCACGATIARADDARIVGIRAYGGSDETRLPILLLNARSIGGGTYQSVGSPFVTIEFDVDAMIEPQLKIIVVHCSRDWQEDWEEFDDNFMHLQTTDVHGTRADPAIRNYGYHYAVRCPDSTRRLSITYSGNYEMIIIDGDDTLGAARFYAVDPFATVTIRTYNDVDYHVDWQPQVQNVEVNASFAPEVFPTELEGMDCIMDHRTLDVMRMDPGDTSADVHVDEYGPVMRFTRFNVIPGNAYRTIDLTNPAVFPASSTPLSLVPRDLVRTGVELNPDLHGAALLNIVAPRDADYLPIRFRLDAMGRRDRDIFLVGAFNDWHPDSAQQMTYNGHEHSYVCTMWLKRGVHEYQYVTGTWNPRMQRVDDQSWTELEGNGWATVKQFTALIYYHDTRYGGLDRIVGCGQNL